MREGDDHNMKDHDLLITIHTIIGQMKSSIDSVLIKIEQKADKVDVGALHSRIEGIEKRVILVEQKNQENAIRKDEIGRIANWGWQVWAKIIGAILFLLTVWQAIQNTNKTPQQPTIIVQPASTVTTTNTK